MNSKEGWDRREARRPIRCSFCGRREDEVRVLVAGPRDVYICDLCIEIGKQVVDQNANSPSPKRTVVSGTEVTADH